MNCTCAGLSWRDGGKWCGPCADGEQHRVDCPMGIAARQEQDRVLRAAREQPTEAPPDSLLDADLEEARRCFAIIENIMGKAAVLLKASATRMRDSRIQRRAFSSSIYIRHETRILLVFHKRFNLWLPLGGEREGNETPLETATRELFEESGKRDTVFPVTSDLEGTPDGFLCYEEHDAGNRGLHMNFAFVALTDSPDTSACDEHTERRWFSYDEIVALEAAGKTPPNVLRIATLALAVPSDPVQ